MEDFYMDNLAERGGQHISTSNELRPQWEPTSLDSFGGDYPPALDMSASPHKVDPREGPEQDMEQYDARPHASSDPGQSFVEGEIPQQDRRKSATAACAMTGKVCKCDNPENSFTGCPSHDSRLSYSHNGTDPTSTIKASGIDNSRTHVGMMTSNPEPGAYALGYLGSRPGSVSMEEHARLVNADYGRTGLASTVLPVDMPLLRPQDADSLPRRVSNRNSQNMQGQDLAPSSERMRPTGQGVNPARSHVMETYRCPPSRLWDSSSWNLVDSRRPLSIEDPNSNSIRLAPSVVTPDKFSDHPVSPRSLSTNPHQGSPIPAPASGLSFANSFSSPASCPSSANSFPSAAPAPYYQTEWASTVPNDLTPSAAPNHSTLSSSNFGDTQSPTWAGPDRLSSGETLEIPFNSLAHNNRLEVTNPSSRRGLSEAQILQTRHQDPSLFLDPNDTHLEHAHANRRRKGSARGQKQAERRSVSSTGENQGSPSSLKRPSEATEATDSSRTRAKRRFTVAEREEINAKRGRVKYCGFDCQRRKIKCTHLPPLSEGGHQSAFGSPLVGLDGSSPHLQSSLAMRVHRPPRLQVPAGPYTPQSSAPQRRPSNIHPELATALPTTPASSNQLTQRSVESLSPRSPHPEGSLVPPPSNMVSIEVGAQFDSHQASPAGLRFSPEDPDLLQYTPDF